MRFLHKEVPDRLGDNISHVPQHNLEVVVNPVSQVLDKGGISSDLSHWLLLGTVSHHSLARVIGLVLLEVKVVREDVVLFGFDNVFDQNARFLALLDQNLSDDVDNLRLQSRESLENAIDNLTRQNLQVTVDVLDQLHRRLLQLFHLGSQQVNEDFDRWETSDIDTFHLDHGLLNRHIGVLLGCVERLQVRVQLVELELDFGTGLHVHLAKTATRLGHRGSARVELTLDLALVLLQELEDHAPDHLHLFGVSRREGRTQIL